MKNKIERNNLFSSKSGYPQFAPWQNEFAESKLATATGIAGSNFVCNRKLNKYRPIIAFGFTLLLAFFSVGNLRAQCAGKSLTYSSVNEPCQGNSLGSASVTFVGGTSQYSYSWSKGGVSVSTSPTSTITGLSAGSYTVVVQDNSSCQLTQVITITEPPAISIAPSSTSVKCNGGNDGTATVSVTGGTYPFAFVWNNGYTNSNINSSTAGNLTAKVYTVTVTDANACTLTQTVAIAEPKAITGSFTLIHGACGSNKGVAQVVGSGGTGALTYSWWIGPGVFGQTVTGLIAGNYTIHVIDANACQVSVYGTVTSICDMVWPGDANHDLVADNNDMLAIGIGYNYTGTLRPAATINWNAQGAFDWGTTLNNGRDYSNVDCNGDGIINGVDTTAIVQNYGLTHALKLAEPVYINGLPDLTFKIPNDTTLSGSSIKVPIMLGTSTNQATGVYGLAFSITYDPKIVDTTKLSLSLNGSWLGTNGTDLIYITKNFGKMGRMDVGITRIDHQNVSGFGKIGDLNIYMRDDISGKIASTLYKKLMLQALQVRAISKDESIIQLNTGRDSIIVEQGITTGINRYNSSTGIKVYPNPASGSFTVDVNSSDIYDMKLVNIIGETVWQKNSNTENKIMVDTQALSAGTYYLSITTSQERIVKQVNIIR